MAEISNLTNYEKLNINFTPNSASQPKPCAPIVHEEKEIELDSLFGF